MTANFIIKPITVVKEILYSLPTVCHTYRTLYFCVRIVLGEKIYLGTESVLTVISSVTFLFSLCVIVFYLSVCVFVFVLTT
jgi:hypothetical protein